MEHNVKQTCRHISRNKFVSHSPGCWYVWRGSYKLIVAIKFILFVSWSLSFYHWKIFIVLLFSYAIRRPEKEYNPKYITKDLNRALVKESEQIRYWHFIILCKCHCWLLLCNYILLICILLGFAVFSSFGLCERKTWMIFEHCDMETPTERGYCHWSYKRLRSEVTSVLFI